MTDEDNSLSEKLIEAIFDAADRFQYLTTPVASAAWKEADKRLSDAIDRAMSHAYAEGRSDQYADMVREQSRAKWETTVRLMNETGQGEHLGVQP